MLKQRWERTRRVAAYFSPLSPHTLFPARLIVIKGERRGARFNKKVLMFYVFNLCMYSYKVRGRRRPPLVPPLVPPLSPPPPLPSSYLAWLRKCECSHRLPIFVPPPRFVIKIDYGGYIRVSGLVQFFLGVHRGQLRVFFFFWFVVVGTNLIHICSRINSDTPKKTALNYFLFVP